MKKSQILDEMELLQINISSYQDQIRELEHSLHLLNEKLSS